MKLQISLRIPVDEECYDGINPMHVWEKNGQMKIIGISLLTCNSSICFPVGVGLNRQN